MREFLEMCTRKGFTLIELVIVVLILGILAAVTVPKIVTQSDTAADNALKQTLSVVRDAIESYQTNNHQKLPGADKKETTFKADLQPYLRVFPRNPVGRYPSKRHRVLMIDNGDPLSWQIDNGTGWIYDIVTGEFGANSKELSSDGVTHYDEF